MPIIPRREFIAITSAAGAWALVGCATRRCPPVTRIDDAPAPLGWLPEERVLIDAAAEDFEIVVQGGPRAKVLRTRARPVPPGADLGAVEQRMIRTMDDAGGVGIAGPQVGLSLRIAVLKLDYKTDRPHVAFVRNPVIVERSDDTVDGYEGCLSIPGVGGLVRRNRWIRVEHTAPDGEPLSAEAEGPNAVLWQHELDHLDGELYVDKLLGELLPMDEVRRLREQSLSPGDHLEGAVFLVRA